MYRVGDSLTKINTAAGVKPDRIVLNHKIPSDVERVAEVTSTVKTIMGCTQGSFCSLGGMSSLNLLVNII